LKNINLSFEEYIQLLKKLENQNNNK